MLFVILRLTLLIVLVWVGYKLVRKFMAPAAPKAPSGQFETMVSCSHCGLHLPQSNAITHAGRHYCCQEHANSSD